MPKREKTPPQGAGPSEVFVRLKPILGIKPGTYLTVVYVLLVLLILFFVLFYPGLRHRGSYLVLSGEPARATVLVDGRFAGSTPCTVFAPMGTRSIEVSKPFYSTDERNESVPGRVFATLIVPQRRSLNYHLDLADAQGLFAWALDDFARNPIIPEIISETTAEVLSAYKGNLPKDIQSKLLSFLDNAMFFITNEQQFRELVIARSTIAAKGGFSTPANFFEVVEQIGQLQEKYDNLPAWTILSSSKETSKQILATAWSSKYAARYLDTVKKLSLEPAPVGSGGSVTLSGVILHAIPSGTLLMGRDDVETTLGKTIDQLMAHAVRVERFFIAETEVTNRQYQAFVSAVPEWKPSNQEALLSTGLVSDGYLATWSDDHFPAGSADLPVTGVSWHAASAYCLWLQAGLAASRPGSIVRLPTEAEWEWAARGGLRGKPYPSGDKPGRSVFYVKDISGPGPAGSSEPNGYGLRDMAGNVWEWCEDSFAPAAYLLSSLDAEENRRLAAALPETSEKVVRGGSWNNQRELLRVYTRGSQPADWCTGQLGFRPAATIP
jgi:formylglycine-generating enzyme required for sulfatase activity